MLGNGEDVHHNFSESEGVYSNTGPTHSLKAQNNLLLLYVYISLLDMYMTYLNQRGRKQ